MSPAEDSRLDRWAAPSGNLLVVYRAEAYPLRGSVRDHLLSFRRYSDARVFYLNLGLRSLPRTLRRLRFDAVIFHTSFLSGRWSASVFERLVKRAQPLRGLGAVRVAMPQDEFFQSEQLSEFITDFDVDLVFSVSPESEWPKIYRSVDRSRVRFQQVLTGYLDDGTVERISQIVGRAPDRAIDIGYRAWHAAPWLGRHGQLKTRIAADFKAAAAGRGLVADISTRTEDTILGDDWLRYLASCKYTIGVEGGASVLDADGTLKERTDAYVAANPEAAFEEIEAHCFPARDGELQLKVLSPRHLEACATRTCQILVEGSYNGILRPNQHYLELKADLSNLEEVLDAVARDDRRETITAAAYEDVVASNQWTYARLVRDVEQAIPPLARTTPIPASFRSWVLCSVTNVIDRMSPPRARWWAPFAARVQRLSGRWLRP